MMGGSVRHADSHYGSGDGIIPRNRGPVRSETIRSAIGVALHRAKAAGGLSHKAVAEAAGKEDRKSVFAYLAGATEMGVEALVKLGADERFGDQFLNDVLGPLLGRHVCPVKTEGADVARLPIGLSELMTALLHAWSDQRLDHRETLVLADLIRPLLPHLNAVVAEADRIAA